MKSAATASDEPNPQQRKGSRLGFFHPSAAHSVFSATVLLMLSTLLSGVLGLIRTKYINYIFGASPETDAYNAAFQLPDMIAYFLVGGVASISLVTILNRYHAQGDDEGADRALSIVLNAMVVVLSLGILVGELLAPLYTRVAFPKFSPDVARLTTSLTRILLPAQLFFFIGGVLGSRLLVRRVFLYQAVAPLIYNLGIILGAVFLHHRLGIYSLAVGVLAGVIIGPAALTAFAALRSGLRYYPILSLGHPAFREWLGLTFPLMVGVSLVTADKWILSYFASSDTGGITRLMVAKSLFIAPMGILGQAAGAASLPFFSSLFSQKRLDDFSRAVSRAVSRVLAAALLMGAWMIALGQPIVDLFRGGSFTAEATRSTAVLFTIFAISIAFWAAQGIYARAFYAAGNTVTPATAGWIVTLASIPVYAMLFRAASLTGLAIASDIGIAIQTITLAVLLHLRNLVRLSSLEFSELARSLLAAIVALAGAWATSHYLRLPYSHTGDVIRIVAGTVAWAALAVAILKFTGSHLLQQLRARF